MKGKKKGGRPKGSCRKKKIPCPAGDRKAFRLKYRPMAKHLCDSGRTYREIATEISSVSGRKVMHSTIGDWIKNDYSQDQQ